MPASRHSSSSVTPPVASPLSSPTPSPTTLEPTSATTSSLGILSFVEARRVVERHAAGVRPSEVETVELLQGLGRVLAEPINADRDFPPFARATRDGYAVRAADVADVPARLEVIGEIKAGNSAAAGDVVVGPGQAVGIMTGAPMPVGADAVVMVEYVAAAGQSVEIQRRVVAGDNFVPRAAEAAAKQKMLDRGRRLDHAAIAIAASVGKSRVQVFRKPRVAVLSTGDELVEIDATPGSTQIRNSNSYSMAAQVQNAGGEAVRLAVAPDKRERLRDLILEGLQCDLLLLSGGVSLGKYDLVEEVLSELEAEFYFTGAEIQPGRPIVFGSCGADTPVRVPEEDKRSTHTAMSNSRNRYFFGLPGNPVSTMVTFELFARPMIEALAGMVPERLIFLNARLKSEIRTKTGLTRFLPAVLSGEFDDAGVELARWQGSGDIAALAGANCYVVIPPDREQIAAGEWVSVLGR